MGEEISATRLIQIVREEVRKEVRTILEERDKELQRALIKIIVEGGRVKEAEARKKPIIAGNK